MPADFPAVTIPDLATLAPLTDTWTDRLTGERRRFSPREVAPVTNTEASGWLAQLPKGKPCRHLAKVRDGWKSRLITAGEEGGAHDEALKAVWAVLRDGRDAHRGASSALTTLREEFIRAVKSRRGDGEPEAEWARMVFDAIPKITAEAAPETEGGDPCNVAGKTEAEVQRALSYERTEIGNAKRLVDRYGSRIRYVPDTKTWIIRNKNGIWQPDMEGIIVERFAQETVEAMKAEEVIYHNPEVDPEKNKDLVAFRKFVKASSTASKLHSMVTLASHAEGITLPAEKLDANPHALACANGVVILTENGYRFRPFKPDDYFTINTGVDFDMMAQSDAWQKFLDTSVPDPELQHWLQIALGYSLLGSNPKRLLFFVNGPTRSGKTTLALCVQEALGEYADPFDLSLFNGNQTERARPDLIRAIPRRIILASEASAAWTLHADHIKRITGGDVIRARQLYSGGYVARTPAFTAWIMTNEFPTIKDADKALFERVIAVPFPHSQEADNSNADYSHHLAREAREAILAWLVHGWEMYCQEGIGDRPYAVNLATMEMRSQLSEIDQFLSDCCIFGPEETAIPKELYLRYREWMADNGTERDAVSNSKFGRIMNDRGFPKTRIPVDASPTYVRQGLSLKKSMKHT